MTSKSIVIVNKETEIVKTQKNTRKKSPVMLMKNAVIENPNKLDVETIIKTEIPDFEIETTPTSIQYVDEDTTKFCPEKYNVADETEINILTQGSTLNKSPVMSLLRTENRNSNFELKEEGQIKTEITDFEIETTPTTIQYVAKETATLSTEEQLIELKKRSEKYLKRPYECETCFIGFFSQKNYDEHLRCHTVSRANGPACSTCDVAFATEQGFILHCRITHDELKPVTEDIITSMEELKEIEGSLEPPQKHNKHNSVKRSEGEQANIEQSNKCNICDKRFAALSWLKRHQRLHTGSKPYKCNICDKTFTRPGNLKYHISLSHTKDKPYACKLCSKRFAALGILKRHERSHNGDKPYECNICDKRFAQLGKLKRHQRLHTGSKPYKCNICDKTFTQSGHLKFHERVHTGHKPYECNLCDKSFTRPGYLKYHINSSHTEDKPYECKLCNKRFAALGILKRHERSHNGDKPYECNICDTKFTHMSDLKCHEMFHTGDKLFQCNVCNEKFTRLNDLTSHVRWHNEDR